MHAQNLAYRTFTHLQCNKMVERTCVFMSDSFSLSSVQCYGISTCNSTNKVVASYIIHFHQPSFRPQNTNSQLRETRSSAWPWRTMSSSDFSTLFSPVTRLAVHKHCFPLVQHLHRNSISSRCANTLMLPDLKCWKLYVLFFST